MARSSDLTSLEERIMSSAKIVAVAVIATASLAACSTVQKINPFHKKDTAAPPAAASLTCDDQRNIAMSAMSTPEQASAARAAMIAANCPAIPQ